MANKVFWVDEPNTVALGAVSPEISSILGGWLNSVFLRIGNNPLQIPSYTVATLPSAADWADSSFTSLVGVSDETGGYTLAFSNGTNWLRVQDLAIVS